MGEIFVLFLIILLVVGPAKLPEIARNIGKAYRTFQTEMQKAQDMLRVTLDDDPAKPATAVVVQPGSGVVDVPDVTEVAPVAPSAVLAAAQASAPPDAITAPESPPADVVAAPTAPEVEPIADDEPEVDPGVVRHYEDT